MHFALEPESEKKKDGKITIRIEVPEEGKGGDESSFSSREANKFPPTLRLKHPEKKKD